MMKQIMKMIILYVLIVAVFCGCSKQNTESNQVSKEDLKGSDEVWYWEQDHTSFIDGNMFYTVSTNGDKLIMFNLSTSEKEYWSMDAGKTIYQLIPSGNNQINAILHHNEKQTYEAVQMNTKTKEIELLAEISGQGLLNNDHVYWLENCKLHQQNLHDKTTEVIADFNGIEFNQNQLWIRFILDNTLIVHRNVYDSDASNLFIIDLKNKTWEYIEVDANQCLGEVSSNTFLKAADEENLYFWAYRTKENIHFKTNLNGKNPEIVMTYPDFKNTTSNTPISENGIYYTAFSRIEGILMEEPKMLLMNWNNEEKKVIGLLNDSVEVNSAVVDGFIKSVTFRDDGLQTIYLTNPKTGKQWCIDAEKLEYYQELENSALNGIDDPIEVIDELSGKSTKADQAGSMITTAGKQVELNGYLYCINDDYTEFYRIHLDTFKKETLSFPEMKKSNFYILSSLEVSDGDLFVHYDCFVQNMRNYGLVQLDGNTLEQKFQIQEFSTASVHNGKLYYITKEDRTKVYVRDMKTNQEELAASSDENISIYGICQNEDNEIWMQVGSRWIDSLYRVNEDKKIVPAIHTNQLGTWNEDTFSLIQTENGLMMSYLSYSNLTVNKRFYRLSDGKAELLTDQIYGEEDIVITENGIFYVVSDDCDPSVVLQSWDDHDPYLNVYFADYAGNLQHLFRLEGTDATLHYSEKLKSLLIYESDWQTEENRTYQFDLKKLQLKEIK